MSAIYFLCKTLIWRLKRAVRLARGNGAAALPLPGMRFIPGAQWHPEPGWKNDPFAKALFSTFIDQARLRYNHP